MDGSGSAELWRGPAFSAGLDVRPCRSSFIRRLALAVGSAFPRADVALGLRGLTVARESAAGFAVSVEDLGESRGLVLGPGMAELEGDEDVQRIVLLACSSDAVLEVERVGRRVRTWRLLAHTDGHATAGRDDPPSLLAPLLAGGYAWLPSWRRPIVTRYRNDRHRIDLAR